MERRVEFWDTATPYFTWGRSSNDWWGSFHYWQYCHGLLLRWVQRHDIFGMWQMDVFLFLVFCHATGSRSPCRWNIHHWCPIVYIPMFDRLINHVLRFLFHHLHLHHHHHHHHHIVFYIPIVALLCVLGTLVLNPLCLPLIAEVASAVPVGRCLQCGGSAWHVVGFVDSWWIDLAEGPVQQFNGEAMAHLWMPKMVIDHILCELILGLAATLHGVRLATRN